MNYIKNIPLFSRLTRTFLSRLSNNFRFIDCTKDHQLFKEGDPADSIYIIKNGQFIVTKKVVQKSEQQENIQEILEDPLKACKLNSKYFSKNKVKKIEKHTIA